MADVFVSYPQSERAWLETLSLQLDAKGVDHYWDDALTTGEWETALMAELRKADAMIVIITQEVCERGEDSYVLKEVTEAIDLGYDMILPVIVGDLNLGKLGTLIGRFQMMRVPTLDDLLRAPHLARFFRYVQTIQDYVAAGGRSSSTANVRATRNAAEVGWPTSGPRLIERQSMAMAVALLEGELPFLISDAARNLQETFEANQPQPKDKTEEPRPEGFEGLSQSQILEELSAERFRVRAGHHLEQEVVRFEDPNRRRAMLDFLWREMPDVRAFMVQWAEGLYQNEATEGLAKHIFAGMAHLAQVDLRGVRYELMSRWLQPPFMISKLETASELLASAYNVRENQPIVREIVLDLALRNTGSAEVDDQCRQAALVVCLSRLGQRAPTLAVEVLQKLAPRFRRGRRWHHGMLKQVTTSDVIYAAKEGADTSSDAASEFETSDQDTPETESPEPQPEATEVLSGDRSTAKGRSLPIAEFLDALATWVDTKVSSEMPQREQDRALLDRQVALWVFLTVFESMPLYDASAKHRLTLETLQGPIRDRQRSLVDQIDRAFVRAATANKRREADYVVREHFERVLRLFAWERRNSRHKMAAPQDPYLAMSRRLYGLIEARRPGFGAFVTRRASQFLTADEIAFITNQTSEIPDKETA